MGGVKKPATYADIEALPEHLTGEIIDGELFVSPRPRSAHNVTQSIVCGILLTRFQLGDGGPGGWWIVSEQELHLGEQVLVPDLAGWRRERLPVMENVVGIQVVPDWVCEVLSPSTAVLDRTRKLATYAAQGVDHLWLVDPVLRTLEVFRRQERTWLLLGAFSNDDRVRAAPFDAIELDLSKWWAASPPKGAAEDGPTWTTASGSR